MTVFSDFKKYSLTHSNATAIIFNNRNISYSDVLILSEKIAAGLRRAGLFPGDRISVHISNRPELISVYYACLSIGAILVPLSLRLSGSEAKQLITHSASRFYIGDTEQYHAWRQAVDSCETLEKRWILDLPSTEETARTRSWDTLTRHAAFSPTDRAPQEIASIFYTSGTTDQPRGIVYTQQTLINSLNQVDATMNPKVNQHSGNRLPIASMVDFISPWSILTSLTALRRGLPVFMAAAHDTQAILHQLQNDKLAWVIGTPANFQAIMDATVQQNIALDLSNTVCVVGGDACPHDLSQNFLAYFGARMQSSYGQTELGGPVIYHPDLCSLDEPAIGWPLPGVEIKIDGGPGHRGQLLLRSPARTLGIWNGSEVDPFPPEQWIATGDTVRQEADGNLLFCGRQKDQIKIEGYPVSPLEVEKALVQHIDIMAAIVFGIPDAVAGERIIAMIQPVPGRRPDPQALRSHLSDHIANYKHPAEFIFVEKLPVMTTGKISRRRIAAEFLSATH
ncbi:MULTISPECIES: class I adenylate-forming enzyme family protein [unclassified Brenneria]|uniref:class I adenylate-forming enzyme family protein n=1 Tax=unclassified Brenneria TaxID=2634434 RepID=UPI001553EF25|nr:class I adenylate-forming enzyme family protein [Brenneria sp. hezel4-2-4]MEE3650600.1 class I adenylate-forming enzyme family protein [Brenneria sp. HEZEL_4_2_4]NPD00555.1 acyl--CoA ligase [Brenneria sp. hezel4-2-4]